MEIGPDSAKLGDTRMLTTINYKFAEKFYAEAGYGKSSFDSMSINGANSTLNDDGTTTTMLGIGYLMPKGNKIGEFWGVGFQSLSSDDADEDGTGILKILSQKNTSRRFGEVSFQRESSDAGNINAIAGMHVWFIQPGLGLGFEWSLSAAKLDAQAIGAEGTLSEQAAGLVFMYRP